MIVIAPRKTVPPGTDLATLAREADVSVPTVCRYIANMRVRPAMQKRIEAAIAALASKSKRASRPRTERAA